MDGQILETERKLRYLDEKVETQRTEIKKLEGVGIMKSQFVYRIANDLTIPLTNIIGFSKLLYSGSFGELNVDQLNKISLIINESSRLADIVHQVREVVQLDSGKMPMELTEVDMAKLGSSTSMKALEEAAVCKGLTFSWSCHYDVPAIKVDSEKITQILINLIGNSIKFTDKGSISVEITKKTNHSIECSVLDTGVGVPDAVRHRLFKEFFGATRPNFLIKNEGAGVGLGLSITKNLVQLHGGKIGYEPREGGGSRFYFTLPIRKTPKAHHIDAI